MTLSQEGMVVIIAVVSRTGGRLLKNPEIISRGFIYLKDSREMVEQVRHKIRTILSKIPQGNHQTADPDYLKTLLREQIGQFLYTKTHRRPMVLPVLIEV
jgi:ribonuclease J